MKGWTQELWWTAFPLSVLLPGGLLVMKFSSGRSLRDLALRFSAGAFFSVITVCLLPELFAGHDLFLVVVGAVVGILLMLLIEQAAAHHDEVRRYDGPRLNAARSAIGVSGIGLTLAGACLGLSWMIGRSPAVLLSLALGMRCFWLGADHIARRYTTSAGKRAAGRSLVVLALCFIWGAGLGSAILHHAPAKLSEFLLTVLAAATMSHVLADLTATSADEVPRPIGTAVFFAGFLFLLIIRINI